MNKKAETMQRASPKRVRISNNEETVIGKQKTKVSFEKVDLQLPETPFDRGS